MTVLGFCEGARYQSGGVGLIGVPGIHRALGDRGHCDALAIAGPPMATARPGLRPTLAEIIESGGGNSTGVVAFDAYGRWCFAPGLYAAAARVAARVDFLTLHSVFSYPVLVGYMLASRFRKPYGLWPHGVFAPVQRGISPRKKAVYSQVLARRIVESASVLFFSAAGERDEMLDMNLHVPSVVIPHGVDVTPFRHLPPAREFRAKYLGGDDVPIVLFLGRLNAKKGLDLLVHAMARVIAAVPRAKLVIAGAPHPPSFEQDVRAHIRDAGISEHTIVTGLLDEADKLRALSACQVFAVPSIAENFGFSMFEAMAAHRPVVCSDTLNYADEARASGAAAVVPRTVEGFADAIVRLLQSPERCSELGENGAILSARYSWDMCGRRLEQAIRCVLTGRPFPSELQPA